MTHDDRPRQADRDPALDDDQDTVEKPLGRDERVSVWPASFEEVVRAMHATPAPRRGRDAPKDEHRDDD
ncbi:hypothetical protein [Jatrophihabitans lederbergiae]|uniref:Uncharacterized protein n=1 Tax=Jatrophihabitans lederbergiae TaxID=3075547 RepID=A0ABU2JIR0_9ACTN|nr:hypothetical protein [Jatrophihabitans sp. DSM 44399]MDT0264379.1 hypothetical protein [Jatrophihabitans sp. DSM 44399]